MPDEKQVTRPDSSLLARWVQDYKKATGREPDLNTYLSEAHRAWQLKDAYVPSSVPQPSPSSQDLESWAADFEVAFGRKPSFLERMAQRSDAFALRAKAWAERPLPPREPLMKQLADLVGSVADKAEVVKALEEGRDINPEIEKRNPNFASFMKGIKRLGDNKPNSGDTDPLFGLPRKKP